MRTLCIVQARMGSTRLPGKVLFEVEGTPLLAYEIERLRLAKRIDRIVIATGEGTENDAVEALAQQIGVDCFRGSENDVLSRYAACAAAYPEYETIVRVTGDCPLIDPRVVDEVITFFEQGGFEYASNVEPPTYPDGLDTEVFSKDALMASEKEAKRPSQREHVTLHLRESKRFKTGNLRNATDYSSVRLTVDNTEDFEVISFLIRTLPSDAGFEEHIRELEAHPEIAKKNQHIERNEGMKKSLREEQR